MRLQSIYHPTDLTEGGQVAFAHALRLALDARGSLRMVHIEPPGEATPWSAFPGVRQFLTRWGLLRPGASKSDVTALGLRPHKWRLPANSPVKALLHDIKTAEPDLIVLAAHARHGLERLLKNSVAQPVARETPQPDLLIPDGARGFVEVETGRVTLGKVLFPVVTHPSPLPGVTCLERIATTLGVQDLEVCLLHLGKGGLPLVTLPDSFKRTQVEREEDVVSGILSQAELFEADLIVMVTQGHDSLQDRILGSTVERVLNDSARPLLNVSSIAPG